MKETVLSKPDRDETRPKVIEAVRASETSEDTK